MYAPPVGSEETLLVTRKGYESLCFEVEMLRNDGRPELIERLRQARNDGDLADNPALYEVLEEQAQLEQRIATLEGQLASARIAEPHDDGTAGIGNTVRLRDLRTNEVVEYELVGGIETNVGNGRVSVEAPVGQALVGAEAGQVVDVATPRGRVQLEVIEVRPSSVQKAA
jgi:transcription elongation factor GreA